MGDMREMSERIVKKKDITALSTLLWTKNIHSERKRNIYTTIFKSIVLYGCGS